MPNLADLITSRICHDLISPVGAIGNGVELLRALGPAAGAEDLDLIAESADLARARIALYRRAFGQVNIGAEMAGTELTDILTTSFTKPRLTPSIGPMPNTLLTSQVQAICLAALCVDRALPRGGELRFTFGTTVTIHGTGDRIVLTERHRSMLSSANTAPTEATEVEFHMLGKLAETQKIEWRVSEADVSILIS